MKESNRSNRVFNIKCNQFALFSYLWGFGVLGFRSESIEDKLEGKLLRVLGMNLYKVETFSRQIFIENLNGDAT